MSHTGEDDTLFEHKINIKDMIIENQIKFYHNCLPESITIQTIINYLHPLFFSTKEEAKYFVVSSATIYSKKIDNIYFNKLSKNFIDKIKYLYEQYFGYINNKGTSLCLFMLPILSTLLLSNYKILLLKNIVNDNVETVFDG